MWLFVALPALVLLAVASLRSLARARTFQLFGTLVAEAHPRDSIVALTAFGWYYAYDAIIYLVTGVLQAKPLGENIGLNIPHVIISGIMLWLAYRGRAKVSAATPVPA